MGGGVANASVHPIVHKQCTACVCKLFLLWRSPNHCDLYQVSNHGWYDEVAGTDPVTGLEKHSFHSIPFHRSIPLHSKTKDLL